jgi:hypothetical protein
MERPWPNASPATSDWEDETRSTAHTMQPEGEEQPAAVSEITQRLQVTRLARARVVRVAQRRTLNISIVQSSDKKVGSYHLELEN